MAHTINGNFALPHVKRASCMMSDILSSWRELARFQEPLGTKSGARIKLRGEGIEKGVRSV